MFLTMIGLGLWAGMKLYSWQFKVRYLYLEITAYAFVFVGALLYLLLPGIL